LPIRTIIAKRPGIKLVSTTITLALFVLLMAGLGKADPAQPAKKEVPRPVEKGQGLKLVGALTETIALPAMEAGVKCHESFIRFKDEKGNLHSYAGVPLWLLVGWVDDESKHGEDSFNDDLADKNYKIIVIGANGKRSVFESRIIARNDSIIVANMKDGKPLSGREGPLKLIGLKLPKNQIVENVIEIHLENIQ
jgi:hypothetical protein